MDQNTTKIAIAKKIFIFATIAAALAIVVFAAIQMNNKADEDQDKAAASAYTKVDGAESLQNGSGKLDSVPATYLSVDFESLRKRNSDVVGWLYQPNTKIDYPVVQSSNNSIYLNKHFDSDYPGTGTIFADYRCDVNNGKNIILYGHNASRVTLTKFSSLLSYLDGPDYLQTHPYFEYYDALTGEGHIYDVFAVVKADTGSQKNIDQYYRNVPDNELSEYAAFLKKQSIYESGIAPKNGQKLLMLSTCITGHYDVRCLICCVERTDCVLDNKAI